MQDAITFNTSGANGRREATCIDRSEVIAFETCDLCNGDIHVLRVISRYGRSMEYRFMSRSDRDAVAVALLPDASEEVQQ